MQLPAALSLTEFPLIISQTRTPREANEEKQSTKEHYKIFIGKIECELFPAFQFPKRVVPAHTLCQYQAEMSSLIVPLPVLMKDEKKYSGVLDVLDQL